MNARVVVLSIVAITGLLGMSVPAAAAAPTTSAAGPAVVATFATRGAQVWRARLTESSAIASARAQLAGTEQIPTFPFGLIVYGAADDNIGYSWHLDNVKMVQAAMEVCDGRPSDVEAHRVTSPFYCPWGTKVIALQDVL